MLKFLLGLLFQRSVSSIVSDIQEKIDQLDDVSNASMQESENLAESIRMLTVQRAEAESEAMRADAISHKLRKLISAK